MAVLVQPFDVPVTLYSPPVVATILAVIEPSDHWYVVAPAAVKVAVFPEQIVLLPLIVMLGLGKISTCAGADDEQLLASVTVAVTS